MNQRSCKVLIVDDSPDDRFFLRMLLAPSSTFEIVGEARDGQEAIDRLKSEITPPDLLFLDLKMPVKNGFDVLQWIQTHDLEKMIVAVMSGSWLQEDITRCLALGADVYFKKTSLKSEQEKMMSDLERLLLERRNQK